MTEDFITLKVHSQVWTSFKRFLRYCKIPLIRYERKIWWIFIRGGRGIFGSKKQFDLRSFKLTCRSFLKYKARILVFFTLCKMWNMFKVNNKYTVDVVLASLLTLNTLRFLLKCSYCWIWSVNCRLWLFVARTLCACWNQFRQVFYLCKNQVNKLH